MSLRGALPKGLQAFHDIVEKEFLAPTIGLIIGAVLFGIILSQTVYYYCTYPNDDRKIKILVAVLCVLELVHLMCLTQAAWVYFIRAKRPEERSLLFRAPLGFSLAFLISFLITTLVQAFYAWRVWLVAHAYRSRHYVVGAILALNCLQFVFGLVTNIPQYGPKSISGSHSKRRSGIFSVWLATSMFGDIVISASLVWFLRRSRAPFRSSQNVVDRLVIYSVNVGLLTTAMAVSTFAVFHIFPSGFQYIGFIDTIIYVNSLLVTLNSRKSLRSAYDSKGAQAYKLSGLDRSALGIHIVKTVEASFN